MLPATIPVSFAAADADGISTTQTPSGAGNLTITGALASGGVATLTPKTGRQDRQVVITCSGSDAGRTFTVYGTNGQGLAISEAIAGSAASTSVSVSYFQTVTRVAVDAGTAGAVTVGTNGVGGSTPWMPDNFCETINISLAIEVTGTINCTVQYTYGDVYAASGYGSLTWWSHATLASITSNTDSSTTKPVIAFRLKQNSFSTGATANLTLLQSGPIQ